MHNLYPAEGLLKTYWTPFLGSHLGLVVSRLDALLMVMKSCRGPTCAAPWDVLHPEGGVKNLQDALDKRFDEFYKDQVAVSFNRCEAGYIMNAEGPQTGYEYRQGLQWSHWT
jgi:hypothetical protein